MFLPTTSTYHAILIFSCRHVLAAYTLYIVSLIVLKVLLNPNLPRCVCDQQAQIVRDTSLMTKEKLSAGLSVFSFWLSRLRDVLGNDPIWHTLTTGDGAWNIESNTEFHRIWSTMQFVFCLPAGRNPFTLE